MLCAALFTMEFLMLFRSLICLVPALWTLVSMAQPIPTSPPYAYAQCNSTNTTYGPTASCKGESSNRNTAFAGFAEVDPSRGSLKLVGRTEVASGEYGGFGEIFSAGLADSIDFGDAHAFDGTIRLHVTGRLIGDLPSNTTSALLATLSVSQNGAARMSASFRGGILAETEHGAFNWGTGLTRIHVLTSRLIELDLAVPFSWTPNLRPLSIYAQISAWPALDRPGLFSIDLGHTALLSVDVPADQAFTSGSGLLLTSAVPEPDSAMLLVAGAIFLAIVSRINRRANEVIA